MVSALRRMIEESHTLTVEAAVNQQKDGAFFSLLTKPSVFAVHGTLGLPSLIFGERTLQQS